MSVPPNTFTDTPIANHTLAADQPVIRSDFSYLANTLGTSLKAGDHQIAFNSNDLVQFEGRHRQVCYNDRTASAPTVAGIGDGVNALTYAAGGDLFMSSANNNGPYRLSTTNTTAPVTDYPYFGLFVNDYYSVGTDFTGGWTFLPGGLILQYGFATNLTQNAANVIKFVIDFPNAAFTVQVTRISNNLSAGATVTTTALTPSQFEALIQGGGSSFSIFWMAIGN